MDGPQGGIRGQNLALRGHQGHPGHILLHDGLVVFQTAEVGAPRLQVARQLRQKQLVVAKLPDAVAAVLKGVLKILNDGFRDGQQLPLFFGDDVVPDAGIVGQGGQHDKAQPQHCCQQQLQQIPPVTVPHTPPPLSTIIARPPDERAKDRCPPKGDICLQCSFYAAA